MKTCKANNCANNVFSNDYCRFHQHKRTDQKYLSMKDKKVKGKKVKLIPLSKLKAKAVKVFNSYIRERDKALGCISCTTGKVDHAGHYMNAGQHSALMFDELNVNGQCIGCNCYKSGNLIYYRMGLVKKIGESAVKELEMTANKTKKWSREELNEIINTYGNIKRTDKCA
jgi:hypothetical protein